MDRNKQIIRVSIVSIGANLALAAAKAIIGWLAGSIAVLLDAVNNLSDALGSVITMIGAKLAGKPPDKKHPYGYGRMESISSTAVAMIVLLAGFTSFVKSVEKIVEPQMANYNAVSLIVIAATVVAKLLLGRYVKKQGRVCNSSSLIASGTDAIFDAFISLSTLVAAIVSMLWQISIEGYLGALISLAIIKVGLDIFRDSMNGIIGQRVEGDLTTRLKKSINSYEQVFGAYDLILHKYGPEKIIGSVHIEVSDKMTAKEIHRLSRRIRDGVYADFGVELTVGIYASYASDAEELQIKDYIFDAVLDMVGEYPHIVQIHGFFIEAEQSRVSFDLVLDFAADGPAIREEIISRLKQQYPQYEVNITLDSDFSD